MTAPSAVRRQARAAAAQQAGLHQPPAAAPAAAAPAPAAAAAPAPNLPNVGVDFAPEVRWQPVDLTKPQGPGVQDPPAPAPAAAPAPAPAAAAPSQPASSPGPGPAAQPVADEPDFKQRYRVLQGKYNAEIAARDAYIRQLQSQVVDTMRAAPAPAAPSIPAREPTLEERAAVYGWTKADIAEYGSELIERMIRTAEVAAQRSVQPVASQLQTVGQQVSATAQRSQAQGRQSVYEALEQQVGADWVLINDSPEFLDWVSEPDVFSGEPRQAGLMRAFEAGDAARVVRIFKAFQEEDARKRATAARQPQVDPATLLAPGQPRGDSAPAAPTDSAGRIWSEEEIGDFYARARRGRIKPDEYKATEAEIARAVAEGRVRPSQQTRHLLNAQ